MALRPSDISTRLRKIASRLDASTSPDRTRVATALRTVLAAVGEPAVRVVVSEDPNFVTVEYLGKVHSAKWPDDADSGELEDVVGDEALIRAALTAWEGDNEFELPASEFAARSGGWWSPLTPGT